MTPRFEAVLRRTPFMRFVPPEHYEALQDLFGFFAVFGGIDPRIRADLLGRPWAQWLIIISPSQVTGALFG